MRDLKYTCHWCGLTGNLTTFEPDFIHQKGFWCPDCDGFTFYDTQDQEQHRMLLLLESGHAYHEPIGLRKTNLKKRLSPLRYPGGKSKLIDFLYHMLQTENLDIFIEVFAGGASLGLALLNAGKINQLVLNDIDPAVHAFWHVILTNPEYLIQKIRDTSINLSEITNAREQIAKPDSQEQMAWAFFILNRTCFSGIISANPMRDLTARYNPDKLIQRIQRIAELASKIKLYNQDGCEFLENYAYWHDKTTLFIDPPYYQKGPKLYTNAFDKHSHAKLAQVLNNLYTSMPGPDIIITYDDCPEIKSLYPFAKIRQIRRAYSIAN